LTLRLQFYSQIQPNPAALDVGLAKKLWEKSETVVGMK
jgi:hypothetical protein